MKTIIARFAALPGVRSVARTFSDRRGVAALEYGLVAALIAVAVIAAMNTFGSGLNTAMGSLGTKLNSQIGSIPDKVTP